MNTLKGIGALVLAFTVCFIANVALATAAGKPTQPNFAVAFAWIGTAPALFFRHIGFWRRLAASLLGSVASVVVPFGFAALNALLLQNEMYAYSPPVVLGIGVYLAMANIGQLAVAYTVARAVVGRGLPGAATSPLAAA